MYAIEECTDPDSEQLTLLMHRLRDKYNADTERDKEIYFVINENETIRYANDHLQELLNCSVQSIVGRKATDFIAPLSRPLFESIVNYLKVTSYEPISFRDFNLLTLDKKNKYFDGIITCNKSNTESHFVVYLQDVTVRKVNEDILSQTNLELDNFIYKASHDLRSPLASLSGLINLTETSVQGKCTSFDEFRDYLELMKRSVKRLDQYISKLAHYNRNNNVEIEYSEIDFHRLLTASIDTYQLLSDANRINFKMNVRETAKVNSDPFRLQLIIDNIISNAIKYQNYHEANPLITISVVATRSNFRIKVKDNGIGIEEELQPKIFNMFQRATAQAQGSGIGLFILKKAVDKMNGKIDFKSKFNVGTEFSITIPNHASDIVLC